MEMREIGFFERGLIFFFGKSYKTTAPGLVAGACTVIVAADQFVAHPVLHVAAGVCGALTAASATLIGIGSKANNVTGVGDDTRILPRGKR